jgi:hypothetical protein
MAASPSLRHAFPQRKLLTDSELPGALSGGAILREVVVKILIRDCQMVLEWEFGGFREEFFLKLLIAECGPILVREVSLLKGPV